MSKNSTLDELRTESGDNLDRLLSDYFKSKLRRPWPASPSVSANEPSVLLATRNAQGEAPRNQPALSRDSSGKSRFTLAASVALLLGTCWYFSNGSQPGERITPSPNGTGMIPDAGAKNPAALEHLRKTNATNEKDKDRPPMKLP